MLAPLVRLWLLASGLAFAVVMHLLCTRSRGYQGQEPLVQALVMLVLQVCIMLLPMGLLSLRWPTPWLSGAATFTVSLGLTWVVTGVCMTLQLLNQEDGCSCQVRAYTLLLLNLTFVIMHQLRALTHL